MCYIYFELILETEIHMKNFEVKQLTQAGLLAALIFILTMLHINNVAGGYIHLGDSLVFFSALLLGPLYGFLAAGIGAMLADLLSGYPQYAIATFFIKGIMTLIVYYGYSLLNKTGGNTKGRGRFGKIFFLSAIASTFMVLGYFLTEILIIDFWGAVANIPLNVVQAVASTLLSVVLLVPVETIILLTLKSK